METIGSYAFYYCQELTAVSLPQSVLTIGQRAFQNCFLLRYVTVAALTPPELSYYAFDNTHAALEIYVPGVSVTAYQEADVWNGYASRISRMDGPEGIS